MNYKYWSKKEENLLRKMWPQKTKEKLVRAFPKRTFASLHEKASKLKVRRIIVEMKGEAGWTKKETEMLDKAWNKLSRKELMEMFPNRGWGGIRSKASKIGSRREVNKQDWGDNELKTLIEHYPKSPRDILEKMLPIRSFAAIKTKAITLGVTRWAPKERAIDKDNQYEEKEKFKGEWFTFGVCSDTHYGSKYAQISWLYHYYGELNRRGIRRCFHAGDLTEGDGSHYRGQRHEMHITGADNLKQFVIDKYPTLKGGKTLLIAGGHDLDLWTKEGYDILKAVCDERKDMEYLGQYSAYYKYANRLFYLLHPSGGTAHAISWRPQKLVESFSSENKPHLFFIGHYHKAEFMPALRNVVCLQTACFQAQTPFATQRGLQFHGGGWIISMLVKEKTERGDWDGIVTIKAEFIPFYIPVANDYKNFGG